MYELPQVVGDCDACELRSGCAEVVWGCGDKNARIMFVADHPGPEDDLMARPFMSREGKNLARLIEAAGIEVARCWYTYAVKCAPGRAVPTVEHINTCLAWLVRELKMCRPVVVVALGKTPTRLLLGLKKSFKLSGVVGEFHTVQYMGAVVAPWHSPHHVLSRGRAIDRETVEFFKRVSEKVKNAGSANAQVVG